MFKRWNSSIAVLEDNISSSSDDSLLVGQSYPSFHQDRLGLGLSLPVFHYMQGIRKEHDASVSQNGIRLCLETTVPIGAKLALRVKFPRMSDVLDLKGIVIWKRPSFNTKIFSECGVAFENLKSFSHKEKIIRFMAEQLCARAFRENYGLSVRPADSKEDLLRVFSLIYREYSVRGYCPSNSYGLHYHMHSLMPESKVFMLERSSDLVGTVSLIADSPCGMPMEKIFPAEIERLRFQGRKLAEVSLLALNHEIFGKKSFSLTDFKKLTGTFNLFKILFDYARYHGFTDLLIAVHPKHKDLYHYLNFQPFADIRSYAQVGGNPALPMHMNIETAVETTPQHTSLYKFFILRNTAAEMLRKNITWYSSLVRPFLFEYLQIWNQLTPAQRAFLRKSYPSLQEPGNRSTLVT